MSAPSRLGWAAVLGVVVVLLIVAARADAYYPGERADADLTAQTNAAIGWWAERGVIGCPDGIVALRADDLSKDDGVSAIGRGADCQVWVLPRVDNYVGQLCATVRHEVGHALGLLGTLHWDEAAGGYVGDAHADRDRYPIMDPDGMVPDDCVPYATRQRELRWEALDRRQTRRWRASGAARRADRRGRKHLRKGSARASVFYCGVLS